MSGRHTAVTLALVAVVSFFIGAIMAGGVARSSVAAGPTTTLQGVHPASRAGASSVPASLPNFADVVEHINSAVVNIDATSKGPELRIVPGRKDGVDAPDQLDPPLGFGISRRDFDAP